MQLSNKHEKGLFILVVRKSEQVSEDSLQDLRNDLLQLLVSVCNVMAMYQVSVVLCTQIFLVHH